MNAPTRIDPTRTIRAPRGTELSCKSWLTEAPFQKRGQVHLQSFELV